MPRDHALGAWFASTSYRFTGRFIRWAGVELIDSRFTPRSVTGSTNRWPAICLWAICNSDLSCITPLSFCSGRTLMKAHQAPLVLIALVICSATPALAALTLVTGAGTTHTGNLVVNGSFEIGAPPNGGANSLYWATGTTSTPFGVPPGWASSGPGPNQGRWGKRWTVAIPTCLERRAPRWPRRDLLQQRHRLCHTTADDAAQRNNYVPQHAHF